jgi:hypothetical protein
MNKSRQFLIHKNNYGSIRIEEMLDAVTFRLSQKQLTELFGKAQSTIS